FGGTDYSYITGTAIDGTGNLYMTGRSVPPNVFPTTPGAFQTAPPPDDGGDNSFVAKLNSTGTALVYSTLLGGTGSDEAWTIAIDPSGNAYVTGSTSSTDYPLKNPIPGVYDAKASGHGFLSELNPSGTALVYSTYVDFAGSVAVDRFGAVYLA